MATSERLHVFEAPGEETRQRLLEAAEVLFARHGFHQTSVRDITARAECNLASINYHFGGKENLYVAVFHRLLAELREYRIQGLRQAIEEPDVDLLRVIETFARVFMDPLVTEGRGPRLMQLFMRELVAPQLPGGMVFRELIEPISAVFLEALHKTCPRLEEEEARLCMHSMVGQLVHLLQMQRIYEGAPEAEASRLDLSRAVEHVVQFTASGILGCVRKDKR